MNSLSETSWTTCDAEFAVITETWLKNADQQWTECSQFNNEGYKIITYSRQSRSGGGLALIYKDKYVVEELEKRQNKSFGVPDMFHQDQGDNSDTSHYLPSRLFKSMPSNSYKHSLTNLFSSYRTS